jgi:hypothetical protein
VPVGDPAALETEPEQPVSAPVDLRATRPISPTEVVQLGKLHFGLSRDAVIAKANELLGERPRTEETLAELWLALVDAHGAPRSADALLAAVVDNGDPGPTPPDDLVDAPPPMAKVSSPEIVREVTQPVPQTTTDFESTETGSSDDEIDIHDLVDAPSHTDQLVERLTEAFPGAELHTTDRLEDDQ